MGAIRGTPDDYDRWAGEFGCAGWGWTEMLEAFLPVEDDVDYGGDGLHGQGGPIPLSRARVRERSRRSTSAMCAAMAELGYPTCDDYHTLGSTGISPWALTVRDGRRVSTNDAYLEPARSRPNLVGARATCWSTASSSTGAARSVCAPRPVKRSPRTR